jgi:ketosteroid isomerase-like protein
MPAYKPEECDLLLIEALNRGDVETVVALYEPMARYVVDSEQVISGQAAIREVLQGYVAAKAFFHAEQVIAIPGAEENLALTSIIGSVRFTEPDGKVVTMKGQSMEVVRRQPDGTWRFIIDNPNAAQWSEVPEGA